MKFNDLDMEKKDLTYSDAIEKVMLHNNYYAPLKLIYGQIWKYKDKSKIKGKTPNMTIQERVQRDKRFIRLQAGIYGLKAYLDKLPDEYNPNILKTEEEENKIAHSHIQGMLIEIGNIKGFKTFSPDKNSLFIGKKLKDITTEEKIPNFTFENILKSIKYIDVIWFNDRNFPNSVFEVENSTDFRNSLVKFVELQDFMTEMILIAPKEKRKLNKFQQEIEKSAFSSIKNRVKFFDYEYIEKLYNNQIAFKEFKSFF